MSACAAYGCKNRPHNKVPGITFHKFPKDITLRNEWLLALRRVSFRPTKYSRLCSEHFSENQIDRTSLACVRLKANAVPNIFKGYPKHLQKKLNEPSSTEKESMLTGKRKYIDEEEDEDCLSDEGLEDLEESIPSSENEEQINRPFNFLNGNRCTSESSNAFNKNGISYHPNILKLIPENVSKETPKLFSPSSLNPDLIDALSSSCQVESSSMAPDSSDTATSEVLLQSKISNEINLQREVQRLKFVNLRYRKKIKLLQQQNRRQKAKIEALENRIKDLETNRTTDDDVSEDSISEKEIYEELWKYQMGIDENSS